MAWVPEGETGQMRAATDAEYVAEIKRLTQERDLALANADAVYAKLMPDVDLMREALAKARDELCRTIDASHLHEVLVGFDVAADLVKDSVNQQRPTETKP